MPGTGRKCDEPRKKKKGEEARARLSYRCLYGLLLLLLRRHAWLAALAALMFCNIEVTMSPVRAASVAAGARLARLPRLPSPVAVVAPSAVAVAGAGADAAPAALATSGGDGFGRFGCFGAFCFGDFWDVVAAVAPEGAVRY